MKFGEEYEMCCLTREFFDIELIGVESRYSNGRYLSQGRRIFVRTRAVFLLKIFQTSNRNSE